MVDFADLEKINALWWEARNIEGAIGNFDHDGRIVAVTISGGPPTGVLPGVPMPPGPYAPRMPATVSTVDWPYPEQMVTSIRGMLSQRLATVNQELAALGVTGDKPEG
jgi:hypothetical protein